MGVDRMFIEYQLEYKDFPKVQKAKSFRSQIKYESASK